MPPYLRRGIWELVNAKQVVLQAVLQFSPKVDRVLMIATTANERAYAAHGQPLKASAGCGSPTCATGTCCR